jgi:replicative superfamily II helicase
MACTIEMVSMTDEVDVAVIDEIQMIGDPFRGWAWTRAVQVCQHPLTSLQAKHTLFVR